MPQPTETVTHTFELRDGETLLAWGDSVGIHYNDPRGAPAVVEALHAWGASLLDSAPEPSPKELLSGAKVVKRVGICLSRP